MAKYFDASKSFKISNRENMFGPPSEEDYKMIKSYLNGDVDRNDIFVYPILLCDNDEDRDGERFNHKALEEIAEKYKGVTGIYDHEHRTDNQHSITYKTEIIKDDNKTNSMGEPYEYVVGYQYTMNNIKNKGLIDDIKAGIKKGASIGFEYKSCKCSICGVNWKNKTCIHEKGKMYEGKKCVGILSDITDAYEWSFVAVPAQRKAGVIKEFNLDKEEKSMDIKQVITKACAGLSNDESSMLMKAFDDKSNDINVKEMTELKAKLKSYEDENAALKKKMSDTSIEAAKAKVYEGLEPVNEKAKKIADDAISDILIIGEDGNVSGIDDAVDLLKSDYGFLFKPAEDDNEDDDEEQEEEQEEKEEDQTEEEDKKKSAKSNKNYAEKSVKQKPSGVSFSMGVQTSKKATKKYTPGIKF